MTRRICSSDWTTPAVAKSLRILPSTSLRLRSSEPARSSEYALAFSLETIFRRPHANELVAAYRSQ